MAERERLEKIAEEYRFKGYDVQIEPPDPDIPEFLGNYRPDLIARRGEENLVIELKSLVSREDRDHFRELAQRIEKEPGWRFVLIAVNPAEELVPGIVLPLLSDAVVDRYVGQARQLFDTGHNEIALLLTWAGIEAQLRSIARDESIPLPRPGTLTLE